jgi:hypothetical protein
LEVARVNCSIVTSVISALAGKLPRRLGVPEPDLARATHRSSAPEAGLGQAIREGARRNWILDGRHAMALPRSGASEGESLRGCGAWCWNSAL